MPTLKRIVCLANSRKVGGRCVAGKELVNGKPGRWIRPVHGEGAGELPLAEIAYEGGGIPAVGDVIDIPVQRRAADGHQQENWRVARRRWVRRGHLTWQYLLNMADSPAPLWFDGTSTHQGLNDEIPLSEVASLRSSLRLVHVPSIELAALRPGAAFGNLKRRLQGRFAHAGTTYWLWVTDPVYERRYLASENDSFHLGECLLTLSISEPYEEKNACYKLIAAIIEPSKGVVT